eukprot:scaffold751_cov395-Prasinococcus_capsulatus_cf.AAC.27
MSRALQEIRPCPAIVFCRAGDGQDLQYPLRFVRSSGEGCGPGWPSLLSQCTYLAITTRCARCVLIRQASRPNLHSSLLVRAPRRPRSVADAAGADTRALQMTSTSMARSPGAGAISACLTNQLKAEKSADFDGRKVSDGCKADLRSFKVERGKSFVQDTKLFDACKPDALKYCSDTDLYPEPGSVLACLREVKDDLTDVCKAQVFRTEEEAAADFATDAALHEKCQPDADALCKDVRPGEGRIQACLRQKRASLSWDCQEELFRSEVEKAGDFRLNYELRNACMGDYKKFCKDIKPGNARAKDCLEDHREDPEFSADCKQKFEDMMERRATDFRLDAKLTKLCATDIEEVCGYEKDSLDTIAGYDGRVIECLQDYKEELTGALCKRRVHRLTMRAAQDIRMDEPLWDACFEDRAQLCPDIPPGSARVLRCLQDNRGELSYECRATLFDQEVRLAEDIDFKYPMKKACTAEIASFCKDIPHGHARVIQCLRAHESSEDMSSECRKEVKRDEIRAASDYRLNYRLNQVCDSDIDSLCADACSPFMGQACGGTVLRCLQVKQNNVTSEECRNEIFQIEKGEADDYRRDAILASTCKPDVQKYCSNVKPGLGRVHRCLRDHSTDISEECKKEELALNIVQSSDVRLNPMLSRACQDEVKAYCKDIAPGAQRTFKCLQENAQQVGFGADCLKEIDRKEKRQARNYKLDFGVAKSCAVDIEDNCQSVNSEGRAKVLKCLTNVYNTTSDGCQHELSRAVRMAIWQYHRGAPLTTDCDGDVVKYCLTSAQARHPGVRVSSLGQNMRCLSKRYQESKELAPGCKYLVGISTTKRLANGASAKSIAKEIVKSEQEAGILTGGGSFITITGWIALAAIAALVLVIIGLGVFLYRKYKGPEKTVYQTVAIKDGGV